MRFIFLTLLLAPIISSASVVANFDQATRNLYLSISEPEAGTLYASLKMRAVENPDASKTKSFALTYLGKQAMSFSCTQRGQSTCEMTVFHGGALTTVDPWHNIAEVRAHNHDWLTKFILPCFRLAPFVPVSSWEQRSEILVSGDKKLKLWFGLTTSSMGGIRDDYYSFHLLFDDAAK